MDLAETGEDHLPGLVIAVEGEGGVLIGQAVDGGDELVLVAACFGFHGKGDDRGRRFDLGVDDRRFLCTEGVSGGRFLQFGDGRDVARDELVDRFLDFSFEEEDVSDPLGDLARGVEDAGVGTERTRIDAEEGEAAGIGIGDGLEDQG